MTFTFTPHHEYGLAPMSSNDLAPIRAYIVEHFGNGFIFHGTSVNNGAIEIGKLVDLDWERQLAERVDAERAELAEFNARRIANGRTVADA